MHAYSKCKDTLTKCIAYTECYSLHFAQCTRILSYSSAWHINICMLAGAHICYIAFDFIFYTKLSCVFKPYITWLTVFYLLNVCIHACMSNSAVVFLLLQPQAAKSAKNRTFHAVRPKCIKKT